MPKRSDLPRRILGFIAEYSETHGFPPTIREICAGTGAGSPGTVHRYIRRLKEQGLLKDTKPGSPRALAICGAAVPGNEQEGARHLCLQTSDGGTLILDCRAVDGHLEFNGPINAGGLRSAKTKVIACRELDEDAWYDAMIL